MRLSLPACDCHRPPARVIARLRGSFWRRNCTAPTAACHGFPPCLSPCTAAVPAGTDTVGNTVPISVRAMNSSITVNQSGLGDTNPPVIRRCTFVGPSAGSTVDFECMVEDVSSWVHHQHAFSRSQELGDDPFQAWPVSLALLHSSLLLLSAATHTSSALPLFFPATANGAFRVLVQRTTLVSEAARTCCSIASLAP